MPRLKMSPVALRDIQRLYRFLTRKNADAAKRAAKAIRQGVKILERQPEMGRPVEDMPEAFREWLIDFGESGYVTRYHYDGGEFVTVLAIRHQKEAGM
ncbi:plasmid stabilization protein [Betaproteobacteria bacterium]|nr:plasmid stabilization protein [Betaproteobacteria bacterium]